MNNRRKIKRRLILSFVMLILFAALLSFCGITLAWFYKGNEQVPADTLRGSIHAAYFNGGDGTAPSENATYKTEGSTYPCYDKGGKTGPYQIDNATQLYNFAWLQYLGYFNDKTVYFVLTDDIDASSLVLPPVGTAENPFIGFFDGNGHRISGLKVSNDKAKLNNTDVDGNKFNIPHSALENNELTDAAEIVGFFGVVGVRGTVYSSSSVVPTVKNVTLYSAEIETQTEKALAGIAAGYVNGVMEDVIVSGTSVIKNKSSVSLSYTDKLSDYSLVGFCEEPYRRRLKVETVDVYEPVAGLDNLGRLGESGSGDAWGNSIDIKDMYQELRNKYDTSHDFPISYVSAKTVEHYNGTSTVFSTVTATVAASINGSNKLRTTKTLANGSEIASYALIQQEGTDNFVYLYGDTEIASPRVSITDIYKEDSYCICYGSNYLTSDLQNTTTYEDAGKWVFKQNGDGTYKIYTISSNTEQYLYMNSNNTLSVGSIPDNWTIEQPYDNKFVISKDGYTLCFKNSLWKLLPPAKNYITDSSKTNYLSVSGGSVANQTNVANAASWDKETFGDGYKLKTVVGSTVYYLKSDDYNVSVTVSDEDAAVWNEIPANGNSKPKIYTNIDNNNGKALYYDGTRWKLVDYTIGGAGNDWGGSIDIKSLDDRLYQLMNKDPFKYDNTKSSFPSEIVTDHTVRRKDGYHHWYYKDDDNSVSTYVGLENNYYESNPANKSIIYRLEGAQNVVNSGSPTNDTKFPVPHTILPILVNDDLTTNESQNTGYIIGGSSGSGGYGAQTRVRVGSYTMNFIGNSISSNGTSSASYVQSQLEVLAVNNTASTYNISNFKRISDVYNSSNSNISSAISGYTKSIDSSSLKKYNNAREQLHNVLNSQSYVHGLHFMGTTIDASKKVKLSKAYINNTEYTSYEMPESCMDFTLKESGYINFFAGSYYSSVNTNSDSFFSLYTVNRSGSTLNSVKEISAIYKNTGANSNTVPYVYKYTDNSYSSGTAGDMVFNMQYLWEVPPVANTLYYFEIPVNAGEYARGAVKNGNTVKERGAYLIYLDISANATVEGDSQFNPGETADPVDKKAAGMVEKTVSSTENTSIMTPPTYFPLVWDNGEVSSSNTGYVISGAHTNSDPPGDIRVSRYNKIHNPDDYTTYKYYRSIYKSLTNGILTDSKIYTYKLGNNGGWQTITQYGTNNLYKYITSKAQLQDTIGRDSTGYVYGLHFMDAQIGTDNLLTVPNATILGKGNMTDYQMPRECIDFNLKDAGYINVFAGTYFSGASVNSFFSLHKIERDADQKITSIREIKAIYKDNGSYNYQYVGESPPSGTKVFDTECLTNPSDIRSDTVYYFEIPVGAGEFAIGSVNGKYGGYLLYLDISTHQGDSVAAREKMVIKTDEYELPEGVTFDRAERTVFEVPITKSGNIEFTVNNGTVTATDPLTARVSSSSRTIEKVTVTDQIGAFSIKRLTEGSAVTYQYSERALNENDDVEALASYFNTSLNRVVFTYCYLLEGDNSVNNDSEGIEYLTDIGLAITKYEITANAIVEAVTAEIIRNDADYIEFNGTAPVLTSQTVKIPVQTTTTA